MKLTVLLLTTALLNVSAKGIAQKVTLDVENVPLQTVFRSIEKQTNYAFFYQYSQLKLGSKVTVHFRDATLPEALDKIFAGQPFTWVMDGRIITIKPRPLEKPSAVPVTLEETPAPLLTLTGMIIGENNIPLAGASVTVKSTQKGTNTDGHGLFQLKGVPENAILVITNIGYNRQEIAVKGIEFIRVQLVVAKSILDEAVVQAYGTTSRRYATGNIATVSSKDIEKQPVMNPLLALQGLVPGLVVTPVANGYPSGIIKVELRGRNSLNSSLPSDPLYIVDGVPLSVVEVATASTTYSTGSSGFIQNNMTGPAGGQNPLFSINPLDIESVSVLKDAEATAIYGARAANGVVLITTKKGKPGKTNFDINVNHGTSFVTRHWDLLNLHQYLGMRNEAFANGGQTPTVTSAPDLRFWDTTHSTDWQKYLWEHQGQTTQAQIALSGGEGQTSFRIGAGYQQQNDITLASGGNQRVAFSAGIQHNSRDRRLSVSLQTNYSYAWVKETTISGEATLPPDALPVYNSQGKLNWAGWGSAQSSFPFGPMLSPYQSKTNLLMTSLTVGYTILKGLTLKVRTGYNDAEVNQPEYTYIAQQNPAYNPTASYTLGDNRTSNWITEPQAEYNGFIGKGRLTVLAGGSIQSTITDATSVKKNPVNGNEA